MLESLGRIQNPIARSLTAALTTLSVVTLTSAIAIGVTKPKDNAAYGTAVYSSLIATVCGAAFGLTYTQKKSSLDSNSVNTDASSVLTMDSTNWTDWRNFIVTRKVKESEEITSFYLQPEDKGEIPNFQPGQFLTIKLDIPGQPRSVIRTYSLSDYADPCTYYRLSIKREPAPPGQTVPPGVASNFMHDQIQEGSIIQAKPPSGKFILDVKKSLPAVLISNGVGITPMISMVKAAVRQNPDRRLWFVHGARDGSFHAFREDVNTIAAEYPNLKVHYAYSRPSVDDTGHYHSTGYVDANLIQSLIMQDAEYFLCGSPSFMDSLLAGLKAAGIPESQVFFEMFSKPKSSRESVSAPSPETLVDAAEIVFARSRQIASWQADSDSLLDFAEANGLNPPYSCRQGICGTCQCRLLAGEVEYQEKPTATIEAGSVLICISKPKSSRLVLDL